jgi:integrase
LLTNTKVKNLKTKEKSYKVSDAHGLYLHVHSNGSKYWRQNYRYSGKQKTLSHGVYPRVSLLEARKRRDEALNQLADGQDPAKSKMLGKLKSENTFEVLAREWFDKEAVNWTDGHQIKVWCSLERDLLPFIGDDPIDRISSIRLLDVLKRVEGRGALDVASRLRQRCDGIFQYALLTGRLEHNPATQLQGVLKTKKVQHLHALSKKEFPKFLSDLDNYDGHPLIRLSAFMLIHTFVRTRELRFAKWEEFDIEARQWIVPANRMKMGEEHIVPLTNQTLDLFEEIKSYNGSREFVFASPQRPRQAISENAIINCIYRMGYKGKTTGHGFRSTASTILNESNFNPDAIERQLAHAKRNKIRAAYNRSEYLDERARLMEWWSNYVESAIKVLP